MRGVPMPARRLMRSRAITGGRRRCDQHIHVTLRGQASLSRDDGLGDQGAGILQRTEHRWTRILCGDR